MKPFIAGNSFPIMKISSDMNVTSQVSDIYADFFPSAKIPQKGSFQ